ncbi:cobyrinate a,c-diamide synthase [Chloroflexota bacterium]
MEGSKVKYPSVLISSPQGHSGKSIVSLGLCAAFRRHGLVVQPFKRGPDYIDPSWLTAAAGRNCRNLDPFLIPEEMCLESFRQASRETDLAIIEGAMGLYDGLDTGGWGSSAHVARLLSTPVILVVNTARMTRSIAAMVMGYQKFEPETDIAGVVLNNVSGSRHENKLRTAVEHYCEMPILGCIPRSDTLYIPQRHLGIIPYREANDTTIVIDRICDSIEEHLDLSEIMAIARRARSNNAADEVAQTKKAAVVRIGIMLDKVFTFYYPENLEALNQSGADLVFIDSLRDQRLPDIDGLYLGGGFPEFFLEELEANHSLRGNIAQAIESGLPVYAECAGLMYLCRGIRWHDKWHEMVGVIHSDVEICQKPQGHGYVEVKVTDQNPLFPIGLTLRGHEFHHSKLSQLDDLSFAYQMRRGQGIDGKVDGIVYKNVMAAYTHLHALGVPQWAEAFVSLALREQKRQPSFV